MVGRNRPYQNYNIFCQYMHIVEFHRAAASGTLAKTAPVINQVRPSLSRGTKPELLFAFIHDQCRNAVRKQAAGAIEFFTVDHIALLGFAIAVWR